MSAAKRRARTASERDRFQCRPADNVCKSRNNSNLTRIIFIRSNAGTIPGGTLLSSFGVERTGGSPIPHAQAKESEESPNSHGQQAG
jgi:hypothetical protein